MEPSLVGMSAIMVGRSKEITILSGLFENNFGVAIVCGIHGIGKTELSNKFVRKILNERKAPLAFMRLNGSTPEALRSSIHATGQALGVPTTTTSNNENGMKKKELTLIEICYGVIDLLLKDCPDKKLLLMVDNVDDDEAIEQIKSILVEAFQNPTKWFVMINTASKNLHMLMLDYVGIGNVIHLDVLQPEDAKQVIRNAIEDAGRDIHVQTLAEYLQYYPLALSLATGCIKMRPNFEINEYLAAFWKERNSVDLDLFTLSLMDHDYKGTLLTTWNIAMNQLKDTGGEIGTPAVEILKIMGYCEPEDIPTKFLWRIYKNCYAGDDEPVSFNMMYEAMSILMDYTIVDGTGILYRINRAYGQIIRAKIQVSCDEVDFLRKIVKAIDGDEVYEALEQGDMAHVMSVWKYTSKYEEMIHEFPTLPKRISDKLYSLNMYKEMLEFSKVNVEKLSEVLKSNHIETMKMESQIGYTLWKIGDPVEALQKYKVAYEKQKSVLGDAHELTLLTGINMSHVLSSLHKWKEALELTRTLFEVKKTNLGSEHPSTLDTMTQLADYLWENACHDPSNNAFDFVTAKVVLRDLIKLQVKVLGNDHPSTLHTKFNLAMQLCSFNQTTRSLELLNEILVSVESAPKGLNGYPAVSTIKEAIDRVVLKGEVQLAKTT